MHGVGAGIADASDAVVFCQRPEFQMSLTWTQDPQSSRFILRTGSADGDTVVFDTRRSDELDLPDT